MMMHMPWVRVTLMAFLIFVGGGVHVTVRIIGARTVHDGHPHR